MPTQKIVIPGGFEVPIPRWTKHFFGIIAVAAISFGSYRYFFPFEPELISVKQANEMLRLEVQEYNKHIIEPPIISWSAPDKAVSIAAFEDGCLLISRRFAGAAFTRLLAAESSRPAPRALGNFKFPEVIPSVSASGCLNQHPGRFTTTYGQKMGDGCWVQVIRSFEDGCVHIQLFNICTGSWATNGDGSPRVTWTRCVH